MTQTIHTPWLEEAWAHLGVQERAGRVSNPRIVAFYRDAGHAEVRSDSVAWCAAFVGACLRRSGVLPSGSLLARSYSRWGEAVDVPRVGAVAVLSRGSDPAAGHVGFVVGSTATDVVLLGGNQNDAVGVMAFPRDRVIAFRWPSDISSSPDPQRHLPSRPLFDVALDHVLEMEGGYTDDPHDPGGPTNLGITLATYASWRHISVTPDTFASLKGELRTLDRNTAAEIYRSRYWSRSRAESLPDALALMHFDASVNHGVAGGRRMLQEVVGVSAEGDIGPDTIAAAHAQPLVDLINRYAELRTARYRALPHFWRFGRGWLNRVAKTRAAALARAADTPQPKEFTMSTLPLEPTPKWWGASMTIWGTILTAVTTVLPAIGPLIGIDVTAEMISGFGHAITAVFQALGGLIGTAMAIYGRIRATQPLTRRPVALRL